MKFSSYCLLIVSLCGSYPLQARWQRNNHAKKTQLKSKKIEWWPQHTYSATLNKISLQITPLSQEQTDRLFMNRGSFLAATRRFFSENPIIPLHFTLKNENPFAIMISQESINLGKNWIGMRHNPLNVKNIYESLNNRLFWSEHLSPCSTIINSINGKFIGAITSYFANHDYFLRCPFFTLNTLRLPDLYTLEPALLLNGDYAHNSVIIQEGKNKEFLIFVWGKHIKKEFNVTLANTEFTVNLLP